MFEFLYGFDENKIKPYLKMTTQRINIANNKKTSQVKHLKREIATLLQNGKEEKARIKTEHVIREDFMIESFELVELLCELVHERVRYMASEKDCPPDLKEAVSSLIWASKRVDIDELGEVRKQLIKKYGKKFAEEADSNEGGVVNERLFNKLSVTPPSALLVMRYLEEIAKEGNVDWTPTDIGLPTSLLSEAIPSPQGFSVPMAPGSELRSAYQRSDNLQEFSSPAAPAAPTSEPEFYPPPFQPPPPYQAALGGKAILPGSTAQLFIAAAGFPPSGSAPSGIIGDGAIGSVYSAAPTPQYVLAPMQPIVQLTPPYVPPAPYGAEVLPNMYPEAPVGASLSSAPPSVAGPTGTSSAASVGPGAGISEDDTSFEALAARFAALQKRE